MPEPALESERFLEAVEQHLPFADGERAEIVDELRAHLADCASALRDAGMAPIEAERAAVDRLGPAGRLADELTRARREPRRLLAAAGAGVWGAVRGGVWGGLVGFGVVMVAAVVLTAANNAALRFLGAEWYSADPGTNSIMGIEVLAIAALVAGRVVTPTVAARAGFAGQVVRRVTVPLGAAILLAYAVLLWSGPLNWPAVIVLLSLPLWWVAGAWQLRPPRLGFPRRLAAGLIAAMMASFAASVLIGPGTSHWVAARVASDSGFDRIGAPVPTALAKAASGASEAGNADEALFLDPGDRGLLTGWRDLRIEAWRGTDLARGAGLDPVETQPFLTAPALWSTDGTWFDGRNTFYSGIPGPWNAATLIGSLRLDHWPGVNWVWLAITGVAPDGTRHLLAAPSGTQVFFSGTAFAWFQAVLAGQ